VPSLTGLYLSQITGGYRPRLRGYGVPSGLQGCNPTNAFCFSFAASWVPRNLGRPPSAVGQSSVTSCCRPYRKELDIKQRPAKNAIRLLRRCRPFTRIDRKGMQAFRTGQHDGTFAGGGPDGRFGRVLRIGWLLRNSFTRSSEEFGNLLEEVLYGITTLLKKSISERPLMHDRGQEFTTDRNCGKSGKSCPDYEQKLKATHVWHAQICHHEIRLDLLDFP